MNRHVSVVLPAYNEEADLERLLRRIGRAMARAETREAFGAQGPLDWEIVVVDDGSADATVEIARRLARQLPVRLIQHDVNRGLGAAIRTGLGAASGSAAVITMDADNTQDPELIPAMLRKLREGNDLVIASRFETGGEEVGVPFGRRVLSHAASGVMRRAAPVRGARDYSCGYRAYQGELLRQMMSRWGADGFVTENGFACMVELLLRAAKLGARVGEVPLVLRYDFKQGASKMRVARTMRRYASVLQAYHLGYPVRTAGEGRALRLVNVALAGTALLLASPLLVAAAVAVRLSSAGPVLQRETRVGMDRRQGQRADSQDRRSLDLGGAPFEMLRFRTRHPERRSQSRSERTAGRPPLTPVGRVLTRYRLDHLPELFNVLRGDMNIVGPRATPPEFVPRLRDAVQEYPVRHRVRPGITGPAQLGLSRGGVSANSRAQVEADVAYVKSRSALEDLRIMARTLPAVFTPPHAA